MSLLRPRPLTFGDGESLPKRAQLRSPKDARLETTVKAKEGESEAPAIGLIMGSSSDWNTMRHTAEALDNFGVRYEKKVVSAHRTPDVLFAYARTAEKRGLRLIIAGAGGAAHLPGMTASKTIVPVIGVPVITTPLNGLDALLSIMQMPAEVGVATVNIGAQGAIDAAFFAAAILAQDSNRLYKRLREKRQGILGAVGTKKRNDQWFGTEVRDYRRA